MTNETQMDAIKQHPDYDANTACRSDSILEIRFTGGPRMGETALVYERDNYYAIWEVDHYAIWYDLDDPTDGWLRDHPYEIVRPIFSI